MEISVTVVVIGNVVERAKNLGYQAEYDDVHRDFFTNRWMKGGVTTIIVPHVSSHVAAMERMTRHKFSVYYAEDTT